MDQAYSSRMSRGGPTELQHLGEDRFSALRAAVRDTGPVAGLTHRFYRYPARFSPRFAAAVIEQFSEPGDIVLDPYMGGGTSVVEAMVRGRQAVGTDINSLACFITRVKTTPLIDMELAGLRLWADRVVPNLSYWDTPSDLSDFICERRAHNLTLPKARPIKKAIALALRTLHDLPSDAAREFARCALLNVGQGFLNGQRQPGSLPEFRTRLQSAVHEMMRASSELLNARADRLQPILHNKSAVDLATLSPFSDGTKARLVVTSPPYPGIHMLYHRWQVDGRRESPAPYWMANCNDGQGNAYYNFADRRDAAESKYYAESLKTLKGVRAVMAEGAIIAQLIAFSEPSRQLPRYLRNMAAAGFRELRFLGHRRIWRDVPSRRWHANLKGRTGGSREVLLLHLAA